MHIPEWVSPANALERREQMTSSKYDVRLDQIVYGCKEKLILLKPWRELFVGSAPKLPPRGTLQISAKAVDVAKPYNPGSEGDYDNTRGVLIRRELMEEIHYISGPVMISRQKQQGKVKMSNTT